MLNLTAPHLLVPSKNEGNERLANLYCEAPSSKDEGFFFVILNTLKDPLPALSRPTFSLLF